MTDPVLPTNGTKIQLTYIEKNLDRLIEKVDNMVTTEQFQMVQKNIDELKTTIENKTAAKWVEKLVWAVMIAFVGGAVAVFWAVVQTRPGP